ncbi:MAG: hypothetical protein JXQ90_08130 [Cyclobacteriaceae bacterium]
MRQLSFLIVTFLLCTTAQATIWRVNSNPGAKANFTNLQSAIDTSAVSAGDTLYIEGSAEDYGDIDLNKQLVLIGVGYFLDDNDLAPFYANARLGQVNVNVENCVLIGLQMDDIYAYKGYLRIQRCYFVDLYNPSGSYNISNIQVIQSYFRETNSYASSKKFTNSTFYNCIIRDGLEELSSCQILNCLFKNVSGYHLIDVDYSNIKNCLVENGTWSTTGSDNNSFSNNLLGATGATYFVEGDSPDGQYVLAESSPAKGAGANGEDCGPFGGINPYVLSGLPPIPNIISMDVPSSGSKTDGLQIKLKIQATN